MHLRTAQMWSLEYTVPEFVDSNFRARFSKTQPALVKHKMSIQNRSGASRKTEKTWMIETKGMPMSAYPFDRMSQEFRKADEQDVAMFAKASDVFFREAWKPEMSHFQVLDKWWKHFFGKELIPWKRVDRRIKFPKAYEELAPYLTRYEK